MNPKLLAAFLVASVIPLASCGGDKSPKPYTLRVDGSAVVSGSRHATLGSGSHKLVVGDTVRITKGTATLALPGRASLELRTGRNESVVKVSAAPTIVDGDALAVAGAKGMGIRAGAASIHLEGVARLRRSSGVTIAVYEGTATVDALGQEIVAPALRQVAVSDTGALPVRPVPLVYDRSRPDPWDVRYLGDAIDLGGQLERRSLALTAQLARPSSDAAFLTSVVPPLRTARGFTASLVDASRSVGESVVGASIALGGDGEFVKRWTDVFDLRREGADWGLVAVDQRARRAAVFGVLDGVLSTGSGTLVTTPGTRRTTTTRRSGSSTTNTTSPAGGSSTTTTAPAIPRITFPPLVLPSSTTTTTTTKPKSKQRSTTTTTPTTTTTTLPLVDLFQGLLGPVVYGVVRPTALHLSDVPSPDDDRRDQRRGCSAQAVLDGLQRLRPVRGAGVPGAACLDARDGARARQDVARAARRL